MEKACSGETLADVVEDFVGQEEFKADGQVEEEFRRRIEGRAVA